MTVLAISSVPSSTAGEPKSPIYTYIHTYIYREREGGRERERERERERKTKYVRFFLLYILDDELFRACLVMQRNK
jgi:hypothetical protein